MRIFTNKQKEELKEYYIENTFDFLELEDNQKQKVEQNANKFINEVFADCDKIAISLWSNDGEDCVELCAELRKEMPNFTEDDYNIGVLFDMFYPCQESYSSGQTMTFEVFEFKRFDENLSDYKVGEWLKHQIMINAFNAGIKSDKMEHSVTAKLFAPNSGDDLTLEEIKLLEMYWTSLFNKAELVKDLTFNVDAFDVENMDDSSFVVSGTLRKTDHFKTFIVFNYYSNTKNIEMIIDFPGEPASFKDFCLKKDNYFKKHCPQCGGRLIAEKAFNPCSMNLDHDYYLYNVIEDETSTYPAFCKKCNENII